jgi:hypothetical protein
MNYVDIVGPEAVGDESEIPINLFVPLREKRNITFNAISYLSECSTTILLEKEFLKMWDICRTSYI